MKRLFNLNTVYIVAVILVLGVLFIPRSIEVFHLRTQGLSYVSNDMENYHNNAHPIEGEYTIKMDLANLAENEGKVLFDDGENQIFVSEVIAHNTMEYELYFRSSGSYSLGGATLVSGVEHIHNNDGMINNFQAEAKATYGGVTYHLSPSKYSDISYRDGDEFSFHLELPNEVILNMEEGMVEVVVTNLYVNLWAEKSS